MAEGFNVTERDVVEDIEGTEQTEQHQHARGEGMDVIFQREHLVRILAAAQSIVERRYPSQILSHVLLQAVAADVPTQDTSAVGGSSREDASEALVRITVTNLDLDLVATCSAQVRRPGMTTVLMTLLYETVRRLPESSPISITFDQETLRLHVRAGSFYAQLATLSESDFPIMPFPTQGAFCLHLPPKMLLTCLEKTRVAISSDESRAYLNGVYIHVQESNLYAVATDGHRLARVTCPLAVQESGADMPSVIIPRKTALHMANVLTLAVANQEKNVALEVTPTKIRLTSATCTLTSKLLEGTFPDYGRVIPHNNDKVVRVPAKSFKDILGRVILVTSERARIVTLRLFVGSLELSSWNPDLGSASECMPVDFGGEDFKIGFNARYLMEIVDSVVQDVVTLSFSTEKGPSLIFGDKEEHILYVLMPMWV